jgi:hypothetical protein
MNRVIGYSTLSLQLACCVCRAKEVSFDIKQKGSDAITLRSSEAGSIDLNMEFVVFFSASDPKTALSPVNEGVKYNITSWESKELPGEKTESKPDVDSNSVGDGFDPRILNANKSFKTQDIFKSARFVTIRAANCRSIESGFAFDFPQNAGFSLKAQVTLPDPLSPPRLSYEFVPKAKGYYSVGFMGAPAFAVDQIDEMWQPLIWQEKRFPKASYMTLAYHCPVPSAFVTMKQVTMGVVIDPDEFPFEPMPLVENSRFGVAVRNSKGLAQPMTFAPVLGLEDSSMQADAAYRFTLRPILVKGDTTEAFEYAARKLYGFRDYRSNALCSLNTTLENMIDYGMSDWSHFRESDKGCSYETDAPGTVKNVSSLNPLEMAMVTDNEEIFTRRAYPYVEYMLSRGKFLFTIDRKQKIQSPSYILNGPCAPISELVALYDIFGRASTVFMDLARQEYEGSRARNLDAKTVGKRWPNAIGMYRVTGDQKYLDFSKKGADEYIRERIDVPATNFMDPEGESMFFWTEVNPRFVYLLELYELTGEARYLEASRKAARRFAQVVWMAPRIPETNVVVNKGGKVPIYWYLKGKGHKQMYCPEETVPAWRLSAIGLTAESVGTSSGHRAIFMANYAPWLIRIGYLADDPFLREIGRSAIIGRYRNFPGYHMNTERTTVHEKADYPLRPHKDLSVSSFHYNHIWPMMSMLLDYLVSETFARSAGAIDFPNQFIEGYAYLQNKCYGTGMGRFYDAKDAILWMPKGLLTTDNNEVNYIAARGENALYLAFLNESENEVTSQVSLNKSLVPQGSYTYRTVSQKGEGRPTGGTFTVTIPARGLTAVTLDGVKVTPKFQPKVMGLNAEDKWKVGYLKTTKPDGWAMILNLGKTVQNAYIHLVDGAEDFNQVDLIYDTGAGRQTITDSSFPFEFTIPLGSGIETLIFTISALKKDGDRIETSPQKLSKN